MASLQGQLLSIHFSLSENTLFVGKCSEKKIKKLGLKIPIFGDGVLGRDKIKLLGRSVARNWIWVGINVN